MVAMDTAAQTLFALNAALLIQLVSLAFAIRSDPYIRKEHGRILLMAIVVVFTLILQNQFVQSPQAMLFGRYKLSDAVLTLLTVYGYCMRPVVLMLFIRILSEDWRPQILAAANALINVTALFDGFAFSIVDGVFYRGPLGYTTHVIGALLLIWDAALSYKYGKEKGASLLPFRVAALMLVATALDTWVLTSYRISLLTVSIVSSCVFYYIWLHLEFVREHEDALMAEQRLQIMISQIQPHFLYNALTAILELCHSNPPQAEIATRNFSNYLRGNMRSIKSKGNIAFAEELRHTQGYLELEKLRFEDSLQICYDIQCTSFELPPLSLQPIAENAVKHSQG